MSGKRDRSQINMGDLRMMLDGVSERESQSLAGISSSDGEKASLNSDQEKDLSTSQKLALFKQAVEAKSSETRLRGDSNADGEGRHKVEFSSQRSFAARLRKPVTNFFKKRGKSQTGEEQQRKKGGKSWNFFGSKSSSDEASVEREEEQPEEIGDSMEEVQTEEQPNLPEDPELLDKTHSRLHAVIEETEESQFEPSSPSLERLSSRRNSGPTFGTLTKDSGFTFEGESPDSGTRRPSMPPRPSQGRQSTIKRSAPARNMLDLVEESEGAEEASPESSASLLARNKILASRNELNKRIAVVFKNVELKEEELLSMKRKVDSATKEVEEKIRATDQRCLDLRQKMTDWKLELQQWASEYEMKVNMRELEWEKGWDARIEDRIRNSLQLTSEDYMDQLKRVSQRLDEVERMRKSSKFQDATSLMLAWLLSGVTAVLPVIFFLLTPFFKLAMIFKHVVKFFRRSSGGGEEDALPQPAKPDSAPSWSKEWNSEHPLKTARELDSEDTRSTMSFSPSGEQQTRRRMGSWDTTSTTTRLK